MKEGKFGAAYAAMKEKFNCIRWKVFLGEESFKCKTKKEKNLQNC